MFQDDEDNEEGNNNPIIRFHTNKIPDSLLQYRHLFIPIRWHYSDIFSHSTIYKYLPDEDAISTPRLDHVRELIDANNKKITCIEKQDFKKSLYEINKSLSRNIHLDFGFTFYLENFDNFSSNYVDQAGFFHRISNDIYLSVYQYNNLMGAKFYYENIESLKMVETNKNLSKNLPKEFENMWKNYHANILQKTMENDLWEAFRLDEHEDPVQFILNRDSYTVIADTTKGDIAYKELWKEIIRNGMSILCQVYIYEKMVADYTTNGDVYNPIPTNDQEFLRKGWDYYEESISKYHVFFDFYHWNMKMQLVKCNAENHIIAEGNNSHFITIKDRGYNPEVSATHNLSFDERNSSMERFLVNTKELLKNKNFKDKNFKDKISSLKSKTSKLVSKLK